jgi:hypothetical protein
MTLRNSFLILVITLLAGSVCTVSGQCNLTHEIKLEHPKAEKSGKIFLDVKHSSEIFTLKLFKLGDRSVDLIDEKQITGSSLTAKRPVFTNLDKGTYFIQASWGTCKFTLGGIEGLQLNQLQN